MTMSTLMCPHCGGRLLIDPTLRLQSMLSCPYCGRKSLMQKKNGMIVLRGIISQLTPPKSLSDDEQMQKPFETETQQSEHIPDPISEIQETALAESLPELTPEVPSAALKSESTPDLVSDSPASTAPEPIAIFVTPSIAPPEVIDPFSATSADTEPDLAADAENDLSFEEIGAFLKHETNPSSRSQIIPPADERIEVVAPTESHEEPMTEIPAEPAAPEAPEELAAPSVPVELAAPSVPEELTVPAVPEELTAPAAFVTRDRSANKERLISLAFRTAAAGQIPAFNSYARQAIDCDPTDPRIYSIRARLIEEAHGFARATFLSPIWVNQTPRQKTWIIAQHFSSLNAAVTYSTEVDQEALAAEAGALIAWQIRETFVENARLRLGKRPFNGKFTRKDLRMAPQIIDACMCINETVVPHVSADMLRSIRQELAKLDPKLADRLERIGF